MVRSQPASEVPVADHGPLGQPCGARGVAEDGQVFAAALLYRALKEVRLFDVQRTSQALDLLEAEQPGLLVAPQALVVPIDHTSARRDLVPNLEQLVALLLVLGKNESRVGVV